MKSKTTEFSFTLKPAKYGIGVFAVHNIKAGTYLRLFGNEGEEDIDVSIMRKKKEIPEFFQQWCLDRGKKLRSPRDFGCMEIGWYMNHSKKPNTRHNKYYEYFAIRNIKAGEEITIDYNSLEEPEEAKDDYYKK